MRRSDSVNTESGRAISWSRSIPVTSIRSDFRSDDSPTYLTALVAHLIIARSAMSATVQVRMPRGKASHTAERPLRWRKVPSLFRSPTREGRQKDDQAVAVDKYMIKSWTPHPFRQFILKIHGRCDLSCDYCYVFT